MSKKRANRSAAFQNTPEVPNKAGDAGTGYADTQSVNKEDGADEGFRKRDTYYRNDAKVHSGRQKAGREFSRKGTFDAEVREEAGIGRMSRKEQKASGNTAVRKASAKSQKAHDRLTKAQRKLPTQTEYTLKQVRDSKTGQMKIVLATKETVKPLKTSASRKMVKKFANEARNTVHQKISEASKDNAGLEAAHRTEKAGEDTYHFVRESLKYQNARKYTKAARLEKKAFKAEVNFRYKKALEKNPELKNSFVKKRMQKARIKKTYAKALRNGAKDKAAQEAASKASSTFTAIAHKLQDAVMKNKVILCTLGAFGLVLIMITGTLSSCTAMFSGGASTTLSGAYMSKPAELDATDLSFTQKEMALQSKIDSIESTNPGYDEYDYNLGEIGHNPATLLNYLSAKLTEFKASDVESELNALYGEMYTLTLTPETVTRTRPVHNDETGADEDEDYQVTILHVKLTVKSLEDIVSEKLTADQKTVYDTLGQTGGLLQVYGTPLALYWYNYVSSYYGYRKNPNTGLQELHRGIDISVPVGTAVYAGQDGKVTTAGYSEEYGNYIVIENDQGYMSKYAHLSRLKVSTGQNVQKGALIGLSGNTGSAIGSSLHLECLYNGEYYNPLFYFEVGEGTLYGEGEDGISQDPGDVDAPDAFSDAKVQALMNEAKKYVGRAYVWGGSTPTTGFDCSGFVKWSVEHSGFSTRSLPHSAQGIYNMCARVSAADAKPGDFIFFTGTYHTSNPVTHIGIYCGDGVMLHCGDPIKYSNINTSYWQSHFYAYGRLR